jgi:Holliday junction resolvase RusA-like endonuclease
MKILVKDHVQFRIVGNPVGWTAPKQGIIKGTKKRITFQTPQLKRWQGCISTQVSILHRPLLIDGPIGVALTFFLTKPKSNKSALPIVKPDLDNLVKSTLDAMKKLVYKDDNVITDIQAKKRWCSDRYDPQGGVPGVDIVFYKIEE